MCDEKSKADETFVQPSKLKEAIDLLYECRDEMATGVTPQAAGLYERVWKWCQANRNTALKAFVQLCAPHGKDLLTCPECAKAAGIGNQR